MFASMRKFLMKPKAQAIDDVESLLYLICFCLDGFNLPWLQDYINQLSTKHFINNRLKKHKQCHNYLYEKMPAPLVKALKHIHSLSNIPDFNSDHFSESEASFQHFNESSKPEKAMKVDYGLVRKCLIDLQHFYETRRTTNGPTRNVEPD